MSTRVAAQGNGRVTLDRHRDVLICGASFAGIAAARELAGSGARVLVVDRYEIGERSTSACGIPTDWLRALGLMEVELQRFAVDRCAWPAEEPPIVHDRLDLRRQNQL